MKRIGCFVVGLMVAVCSTQFSYAAEHGGKEHGGASVEKEHGGSEHKGSKGAGYVEPTSQNIRQAMENYVMEKSKKTGTFEVYDPEINKTRKLSLVRVHERVGKTGDYYYSCADFTDEDTGKLLDLDLDVEHKDGNLSVVDVRIHKVDGNERYTYDENDNRIPVLN